MLRTRITFLATIVAVVATWNSAIAGTISSVDLAAGMYEVNASDVVEVEITVTTDGDLTSVNPAISLDPVVGTGSAVIVPGSGADGSFWGGQATTVTEVLESGNAAGKFNVSLDDLGASSTGGPKVVVSFDVAIPGTSEIGDKWDITFLTGSTGSTWSELGGSGAETTFSSLTSGMITVVGVPEPNAIGMFLIGVLVVLRRRRVET